MRDGNSNLVMSKFKEIVGADNVSVDKQNIMAYARAGFRSGAEPDCILSPTEAEQVRDIVRLARREGVNLVASSSGYPHFKGGSIVDGSGVIVDLSKMNQVVRVDRRNKVAMIEPGVTFEKLIAAADQAGLKALLPLMPRHNKSVLAAYLEREPIMIPKYHWDMTDPLFCTEVVFGTGDFYRTGSAGGPGTIEGQWEQGNAQINPMGPGQSDLMRVVQGSQSSMGIVTWATVKLEVKPQLHRLYFLQGKLETLIDFAYRALRVKLGDEFFIVNSCTLATMLAGKATEIAELSKLQPAPYTLIYGVAGYQTCAEERIAFQEKHLGLIAQAVGLLSTRRIPGATAQQMMKIILEPSPEPFYKTVPKGAFWDIFFMTTMDQVSKFEDVMSRVSDEHSYDSSEIGIYIQPVMHGRACHVAFTGYYDAQNEKETIKARMFFSKASKALGDSGAFYSRPYGEWADIAYSKCKDTVDALRKVKNLLDPDGILNRGKLCFGEVR